MKSGWHEASFIWDERRMNWSMKSLYVGTWVESHLMTWSKLPVAWWCPRSFGQCLCFQILSVFSWQESLAVLGQTWGIFCSAAKLWILCYWCHFLKIIKVIKHSFECASNKLWDLDVLLGWGQGVYLILCVL